MCIRRGVRTVRHEVGREKKVVIYQVDGMPINPQIGFYAISYGSKHAEHALYVRQRGAIWTVYLDGVELSSPTMDWREAFGKVYRENLGYLWGRPVKMLEYKNLAQARQLDTLRGVDARRPINLSTSQVAI